jgi:HSP20 family molecular chaperone IbpA
MENAAAQRNRSAESPSVVQALWDPFGFMQAMFGWGRSSDVRPLFEVKETGDTYVCKVKVPLTLPDQADLAHARAELDNGELTLVVPKAAVAAPEPASPPRKRRQVKGGTRATRARRR